MRVHGLTTGARSPLGMSLCVRVRVYVCVRVRVYVCVRVRVYVCVHNLTTGTGSTCGVVVRRASCM